MIRLGQLSDPSPQPRPTVPPAPFDLDTSHRDETAPRSAPIRRPWRQTTPHEPVFVRELRKAFKEEMGL